MVEFAIALPLLLLLMLATAEFGRLISQYDTLTKAVRDGARYAASTAANGSTGLVYISPQIQTAVANLVSSGNINGSGPALLPGLSAANVTVSDAGNGYVLVSASYSYVPMLGTTLPTFGLGRPISLSLTLNAASTMRAL
jgi:Flp pilus assembly protein TadG